MSAILFGSISTIADTSELQRESFNEAFAAHDLDWQWDRDDYRDQLRGNGGEQRIADFAAARGVEVDAGAVHRTKSEIFQRRLADGRLPVRPGVVDTIRTAKEQGHQVALVTTTSPDNVRGVLDAVSSELDAGLFDLVVDSSAVGAPKPDPAAYAWALDQLRADGAEAVAVEDNLGGVSAAKAAGIATIAFPNANTSDHDFSQADLRVDALDPATVTRVLARD